jgi:hypothetical protein
MWVASTPATDAVLNFRRAVRQKRSVRFDYPLDRLTWHIAEFRVELIPRFTGGMGEALLLCGVRFTLKRIKNGAANNKA